MTRLAQVESRPETVRKTASGTRLPWWLWPNLLGLDAPLIAVLWQDLFARTVNVALFPIARLALFLAVWAVYLGDHLLDASGAQESHGAARHVFCRKHTPGVAALFACVAMSGIVVAAFLRRALFVDGVAIAVAVAVYFSFVHVLQLERWQRIPKELLVAALFSAGTTIAPWARNGDRPTLALAGAAFLVVCLMNTTLIEYYEWVRLRESEDGPPHPFSRWIAVHPGVAALAVGVAAVFGISAVPAARPALAASVCSALLLVCLDRLQHRTAPDLFRVLADAALVTPLLTLLPVPV